MKVVLLKLMVISWLLFTASHSVQAEPYFTNKEGSMIWDKATGLVWMRCSWGQAWDGKTCNGEAKAATYEYVQKENGSIYNPTSNGGFADWQIPSIRALLSIRACSTGFGKFAEDLGDGKPLVTRECADGLLAPAIDSSVFSNTPRAEYWSSTTLVNSPNHAWYVNFDEGYVHYRSKKSYLLHIRLVRASQLSDNEAASFFPINLTEQRQTAEKTERAERLAAERKAQEEAVAAENKAKTDRSEALTQLLTLGARGLYLEAGKAQRSGYVTFVNTRFAAEELYEMIVNKFADSDYAVKAMDQLTAMGRSSREQSAAQSAADQSDFNARQRAYEACKIEMNSCYNCTNGKGICYRDCEGLR